MCLVRLGAHKDPSALHLAAPQAFAANWAVACEASTAWRDQEDAERASQAEEAARAAGDLLRAPDLLQRVVVAMRADGFAGDTTPAELASVALTSRLLERPMNLAFVGPSAAGKNYVVDAALAFIPPAAVHMVSASSPRALIYTEEDFEHRVVVVREADSIPDDGAAGSAIRSLAEDNAMTYEVVEKNGKTGRHETRRIDKPGPTGLITTSTRSLRTQLGTRHLEAPIPDDAAQTRKVMHAHARRAAGRSATPCDRSAFLAFQEWLALVDLGSVFVPFAEVLADAVPSDAVRMRRDFRQLLTCIQAMAVLRLRLRERTDTGSIVAVIDDYAEARRLLMPIFDTLAAEGVSAVMRTTVEAVPSEGEISEAALARHLAIAVSTAHYRVGKALRGGWLVNDEPRKGHKARLRRGAPLPEPKMALPDPDRVQELFECSNVFPPDEGAPPPAVGDAAGEMAVLWV